MQRVKYRANDPCPCGHDEIYARKLGWYCASCRMRYWTEKQRAAIHEQIAELKGASPRSPGGRELARLQALLTEKDEPK